jgi:hypothetical protein
VTLRILSDKSIRFINEKHVLFVTASKFPAKRTLNLIVCETGPIKGLRVSELYRRIENLFAFQAANTAFGHFIPRSIGSAILRPAGEH